MRIPSSLQFAFRINIQYQTHWNANKNTKYVLPVTPTNWQIDINSDKTSGILLDIYSDMYIYIYSDTWSEMCSEISLNFLWPFYLAFYLTFLLTFYLAFYRHAIWHSIGHRIWHLWLALLAYCSGPASSRELLNGLLLDDLGVPLLKKKPLHTQIISLYYDYWYWSNI